MSWENSQYPFLHQIPFFCHCFPKNQACFWDLVKNFLSGEKNGRFYYFDAFFLICIVKEVLLHFNSWVYSFALSSTCLEFHDSVFTLFSHIYFWEILTSFCSVLVNFLWFSLSNSVVDYQTFDYTISGTCQSKKLYMFPNITNVLHWNESLYVMKSKLIKLFFCISEEWITTIKLFMGIRFKQ